MKKNIKVDDSMALCPESTAWRDACLILLFFSIVRMPLSWHKVRVHPQCTYLGFAIDAWQYSLGLEASKLEKLTLFLGNLRSGQRIDRKVLEQGCGRLIWTSFLFPRLRGWLSSFFASLNRPGERWIKCTPWEVRMRAK